MTRGVDNVDVVIFPMAVSGCRLNGDSTFSFKLHGVHFCTNAIFTTNIVNGMDLTGVKQDALGEGGFPNQCVR